VVCNCLSREFPKAHHSVREVEPMNHATPRCLLSSSLNVHDSTAMRIQEANPDLWPDLGVQVASENVYANV